MWLLARNRAEQMVQRTQVVKAAEARARKVLETAETEARQLRLEAEDYCDQEMIRAVSHQVCVVNVEFSDSAT